MIEQSADRAHLLTKVVSSWICSQRGQQTHTEGRIIRLDEIGRPNGRLPASGLGIDVRSSTYETVRIVHSCARGMFRFPRVGWNIDSVDSRKERKAKQTISTPFRDELFLSSDAHPAVS